jgi:hypothetical protein
MPVEKRVSITSDKAGLTDEEAELLGSGGGLGLEEADRMLPHQRERSADTHGD